VAAFLPLLITLLAQAPATTPAPSHCMKRLDYGGGTARVWRFQYDAKGRLLSKVAHNVTAAGTTPWVLHTYEYDASGLNTVERSSDMAGWTTVWTRTYDAAKRPISVTVKGNITEVTEYSYDSRGRKVLETTGTTHVVSTWNADGRLEKTETTADAERVSSTRYEYDASGNVIRTETESPGKTVITTFTWDASGRPLTESVTGAQTVNVTYQYSCSEPFPIVTTVAKGIRAFPGPCHSMTDLGSGQQEWGKYAYEGGRNVSVTDYFVGGPKEKYVKHTFDAKGNEISELRYAWRSERESEIRRTFTYGADGARSEDEDGDGTIDTITTFQKDAAGRVVSETLTTNIHGERPRRYVYHLEHDASGRLLRKEELGRPARRYQYDDKGNLVAMKPRKKDSRAGLTSYYYDCWLHPKWRGADAATGSIAFQDWHGTEPIATPAVTATPAEKLPPAP
jgi:YD repeat-containing protein